MKKLVKTAKQQFEERLASLCNVKKIEYSTSEGFYTASENDGRFVLLYYNGDEYYETLYQTTYNDLLLSDEFLSDISCRFIHLARDIKPLFEWYKDTFNNKEPFDLYDIWMTSNVGSFTEYKDIYEEVPDSISAKEQWEKDSADAITLYEDKAETYKVYKDADTIVFFRRCNGDYYKYNPLSISELRQSPDFIAKYYTVVLQGHPSDISSAAKWINTGEYDMSDISLLDIWEAIGSKMMSEKYKDIQPVKEMVKLTPEQREALNMVEEALDLFRERGGRFVFYSHDEEFFAVNGNGIKYETSNNSDTIDKLIKDGFVDVSDVATAEPLGYIADYHWATDGNLLAVTD